MMIVYSVVHKVNVFEFQETEFKRYNRDVYNLALIAITGHFDWLVQNCVLNIDRFTFKQRWL